MRYRLILEFDCAGLAGIPEILSDISARLEGIPVLFIDLRRADATRSVMEAVADAPCETDVVCYFKELPLPRGVNSFDEAMRFYNFNKAQGWKRAYEWRALARAWVARIRVDGKAQSFDVDEFFDAAVAASMKSEK
jgi:hypothetical protein